MPKQKYYWKALKIDRSGRLRSRIILGKYCLVYPVGQWVKPPVGKIFIFRTQQEAIHFNGKGIDACIKKCEARGITIPRGTISPFFRNTRRFLRFWRTIFQNGSLPKSYDWPDGTLWAESIKIIE